MSVRVGMKAEDYIDKDPRGKIVLVEVSYAPATPEKARIAAEKGTIGIVCINWGRRTGNKYACIEVSMG